MKHSSPKTAYLLGHEKQRLDKGPGAVLRPIISKAIRGRHQEIASQLTTKSGRRITVGMLYDWCAPTKPNARIPADLVALLCEGLGDDQLQREILSPRLRELLKLGEFVAHLIAEHCIVRRGGSMATTVYIAPATKAQLRIRVGNMFTDRGKNMMVTSVGEPYTTGAEDMRPGQLVFDVAAVEVATDSTKKAPRRRSSKTAL